MLFPRIAGLACAASLFAAAASAETATFVIASVDGYGIDECMAAGQPCGRAAADAWCRSRDYQSVVDFGRRERVQPAGPLTDGAATCTGKACRNAIAIVCVR